ncbi:DUF3365 domain-containing protein [Fundidesulfovibrio butyratiphilus]
MIKRMLFIKPGHLQTKFLLWLAAIMVLVGLISISLLRLHLRAMLEEDVRGKARLILSNVDALEGFMDQALQPAMCEVLAGERFMRESMHMSRTVMVPGEPEKEQFHYRRAGFGALAGASGSSPQEKQLENRFAENPTAQLEEFFTRQHGEETYVAARPLRARPGCLRCHGGPDQASADLRERMGDQWAGFGWKEGQLVGAQVVSLPLRGSLSRIHEATWGFILLFAVGGLGLYALISMLFNRLVVHNLKRVLGVMRHYFPEEAKERGRPTGRVDEIEELVHSVEDFAGSLRQARSELKSHADTLEQRVAERTAELTREAEARNEDVALFMGLLNGLTRSHTRQEMLNSSLELIGRRFGAHQVSYCCTLSNGATHTWPRRDLYTPLPPDWHTMVSQGQSRIVDQCVMVPVQTAEVRRGLLAVCWGKDNPPDAHSLEMLGAVGRQLGVVMENLEALGGLVRQNDLLQSVFDGITDPLMLLDDLGRVVMANSSASDLPLSGLPTDPDLAGIDLEDQPANGFLSLALGIEPGKPLPQQMLRAPQMREARLPGDRWFMVSVYPPRHYLGRGGGLVVYVREVTAERRMLEKSQQNEKLLAVGRLAAGLAHEMNNPLGVILCYAELLKGQIGENRHLEDLDIIIKHTIQAQKVLGDLLCFVRPSKVEPAPCDLAGTARQTVEIYQARAAVREAELVFEETGPVMVMADTAALEQVLANLVINALDAAGAPGGRVIVRCAREGDRAYLKVRDNGPGVPAENRQRIFEPFFTTKEVGRGTGLGLAVVYGLVADMGGSVEVSEGPGAQFTVWLNLAREVTHESL